MLVCPPEMLSCKHALVLDQSATTSETNTAPIATDYLPAHERLEPSNFIGFIIVIAVIIFGLSLWGIRSLWAKRKGSKGDMGENKLKAEEMAEEWIKNKRGQDVGQAEKVLNIVQMNEIEYGEGWKTTSSAPSHDEANVNNQPAQKEGGFRVAGISLHD